MKRKSFTVENWEQLVAKLNTMNYYKDTILLTGWLNEIVDGELKIKQLVFTVVPAETTAVIEDVVVSYKSKR